MPDLPNVLHVGCGTQEVHWWFQSWQEVRLDIDPAMRADITASITDMHVIADAQFDAVYSEHNLEHLYPHEVPVALREFHRILKPTGFALITLPDLQSVCHRIADGQLTQPAYMSPSGPIFALDMLFGHRPSLAAGHLFMAHKTGFTDQSLNEALRTAGFAAVVTVCNAEKFSLWSMAFVTQPDPSNVDGIVEKVTQIAA